MSLELITAFQVRNDQGTIQIYEKDRLPFPPKRIFWITDVPKLSKRGGHAHIECYQFIFCVNGAVDIKVDGIDEAIRLNQDSWHGLFVPPMNWIDLRFIRPKSKIVVLASHEYAEGDYIRDYGKFKLLQNPIQ